jgi:hypothetical protein
MPEPMAERTAKQKAADKKNGERLKRWKRGHGGGSSKSSSSKGNGGSHHRAPFRIWGGRSKHHLLPIAAGAVALGVLAKGTSGGILGLGTGDSAWNHLRNAFQQRNASQIRWAAQQFVASATSKDLIAPAMIAVAGAAEGEFARKTSIGRKLRRWTTVEGVSVV